jgi:hypothetical protein
MQKGQELSCPFFIYADFEFGIAALRLGYGQDGCQQNLIKLGRAANHFGNGIF